MLKRCLQVGIVLFAGLLSGCSLIQKGLQQVTPEISVGVYKDGVGGVTIGVKLEANKDAAQPASDEPKVEEPEKEDK